MNTHTTTHAAQPTPAQLEDQSIQLHREFVEIVREEIGMNERFANDVASALVRGMRKRYGGQTLGRRGAIYVPAPDKTERNTAIRAEFNGTNAAQVCTRYQISRSRLYQIVNSKP
jgi:Mor family transcriptional regulator